MPKINRKNLIKLAIFAVVYKSSLSFAQDNDAAVSSIYGETEATQSIAAGYPVPRQLSPSVTSVITSQDIERIGAKRLLDVLEYLPGVHIVQDRSGHNIIGFRGIYSSSNNQVLVLVNGTPLRDLMLGGHPYDWDMPVKNISHVEIIRGPGSMLYGSDATSGVINVVTKTGKELNGGKIGSFVGNYNTYDGFAQFGKKETDWEYAVSLQGGRTSGNSENLSSDAQAYINRLFQETQSASQGTTQFGRDEVDARLDVSFRDLFRVRAGYQRFNNKQPGTGIANNLNLTGNNSENLYTLDITSDHSFTDSLNMNSKAYFTGQDLTLNYNQLPDGTLGGFLPRGAKSVVSFSEKTTGFTSQFHYKHGDSTWLFGTGLAHTWMSDVSNQQNYWLSSLGMPVEIPMTELSQLTSDPLKKIKRRTNFYSLLQNEFKFASDLYLTTGFRYDYYSDSNPGFSPRLALVWNIGPHTTSKLMYSRAFRPPGFLERSLATTNSTLKSETTNTVEFQLEHEWNYNLITSANVFWFNFDNLMYITSAADAMRTNTVSSRNAAPMRGVGVEAELRYNYFDNITFSANYSFHQVSHSDQAGLLPQHMIKVLADWQFMPKWRIGTQLSYIGERVWPDRTRKVNVDGYFLTGITLSTNLTQNTLISFRANNIFNSIDKLPSTNPILLPGDIPLLDRTFLGQVSWSFN